MKLTFPLIFVTLLFAKISFSQCSFTAGISVSNAGPCGSPTLTLNNSNADGVWAQKASFTGGRWLAAGFSIGSKGYIGTGTVTGFPSTLLNDFWEYDAATDAWTQKADFGGTPRMAAVGFSIGNKGYIGAGYINMSLYANDFWEYDPATNTWTQKADIGPTERSSAFSFVLNGKGYVGTGRTTNNNSLNDVWEYDPTLDTWTQKNNFGGITRSGATAFALNGKGYAGTGLSGNGPSLNDFWEYNPIADSWAQKANFAGGPIRGSVGMAIGNRGFLATGYKNSNYSNVFWEYDAVTDTWAQKANFAGIIREGATGFVIGPKAYIAAGYSYTSGFVNFNDLWEYDPTVAISWSNGSAQQSISAPASGIYSVTVTDQLGCSVVATQSITSNAVPLSVTGPTTLCAGSSVNLHANGAGTYTWSSNAGNATSANVQVSPTTSTSYTVNGTLGSGCEAAPAVVTVSVLPSLPMSISGPSVICEGKSILLTASGANSYVWNNGVTSASVLITPVSGTVYSVNGIGNMPCSGSASIAVTVNAAPLITTASSNTLICPGETTTLTAGGANLFIWSTGAVAASAVIQPMATTVYTVTGMSAEGCSKTATVTQEVAACTGINTIGANDHSFKVYPNPTQGVLTIESTFAGHANVELYNYMGQLISLQEITTPATTLNFESAAGIYTVKVISNNKPVFVSKVVKH